MQERIVYPLVADQSIREQGNRMSLMTGQTKRSEFSVLFRLLPVIGVRLSQLRRVNSSTLLSLRIDLVHLL